MKTEECTGIICPCCGYLIKDWGVMTCPRCNTSLLDLKKCNGDCGKCYVKRRD